METLYPWLGKGVGMLIVYDLDGTLIDSTEALLRGQAAAWASVGRPCPPREQILERIGLPLIQIMEELGPGEDPVALAAEYSRGYKAAALECESIFEGMRACLAHPYKAAVATGKSQSGAERAVARHGLTERFDVILGGNSVPNPKPHPDMLHALMQQTGETELVMIGDTTFDLEMARSAGALPIGVSWGHHSVDRLRPFGQVVHSPAELEALLLQLTRATI